MENQSIETGKFFTIDAEGKFTEVENQHSAPSVFQNINRQKGTKVWYLNGEKQDLANSDVIAKIKEMYPILNQPTDFELKYSKDGSLMSHTESDLFWGCRGTLNAEIYIGTLPTFVTIPKTENLRQAMYEIVAAKEKSEKCARLFFNSIVFMLKDYPDISLKDFVELICNETGISCIRYIDELPIYLNEFRKFKIRPIINNWLGSLILQKPITSIRKEMFVGIIC